MISTETARNSEIAEVFRNHQDIFVSNASRDHLILVTFMMYERNKGKLSFWHEWFEVA